MLSSPVPALDGAPAGAPAPANSSSAAASAVAAVKSSAKSKKQGFGVRIYSGPASDPTLLSKKVEVPG